MRKMIWLLPVCASLLSLSCASMGQSTQKSGAEEKEGKEEKVAMTQAPAAVQKTFAAEAPGAKIDQVDKESEDGKTTYEADVMLGGKNYEIKVAEDGSLIGKKLDDESAEKNKNEEKEEKGDKKGEKDKD